jgi:choline dehydrogenase
VTTREWFQLSGGFSPEGAIMPDTFDFIIVGSGPGGSTLAYRLGELSGTTILILEAGGRDLPEAVQVPYRWNELLLTDLDWAYNSAPQPGLNNRQIYSAGAGRRAVARSSTT